MCQGIAWGHTLTLGLFGGFVLLLGKTISKNLSQWLGLGVGVLRCVFRDRVHFDAHKHTAWQGLLHLYYCRWECYRGP